MNMEKLINAFNFFKVIFILNTSHLLRYLHIYNHIFIHSFFLHISYTYLHLSYIHRHILCAYICLQQTCMLGYEKGDILVLSVVSISAFHCILAPFKKTDYIVNYAKCLIFSTWLMP